MHKTHPQTTTKAFKPFIFSLFLMGGLLFHSLSANAEAPVGDWIVRGQNPADERTYKGQVSVIKSGDTYTVLWRFGATTYIGTGIDLENHFAITFKPAESMVVGLLLLQKKEGIWQGRWTQMGSQSVGTEVWKKLGS